MRVSLRQSFEALSKVNKSLPFQERTPLQQAALTGTLPGGSILLGYPTGFGFAESPHYTSQYLKEVSLYITCACCSFGKHWQIQMPMSKTPKLMDGQITHGKNILGAVQGAHLLNSQHPQRMAHVTTFTALCRAGLESHPAAPMQGTGLDGSESCISSEPHLSEKWTCLIF